jgi:hypothetical protein
MSRFSRLCLSVSVCVVWAAAAHATSLTLSAADCDALSGGCRGANLALDVADQGDGSFVVTYTINTTGLNTGGGNFTGLNQIGFLTIKDWTSVGLISAPNGVANWTDPIEAVVHSGALCTLSNGDPDKICSAAKNNFLDMSGGGDFVWKFKVVGGTELDTSEWHFSGQWTNELGPARGNIISVGAPGSPPVPEPTAALLFAVGMLTVGQTLRRPARRVA